MSTVDSIGLDLAKNVFQAHSAGTDESVVFLRELTRRGMKLVISDAYEGIKTGVPR